jgi:hypothetical protein
VPRIQQWDIGEKYPMITGRREASYLAANLSASSIPAVASAKRNFSLEISFKNFEKCLTFCSKVQRGKSGQ